MRLRTHTLGCKVNQYETELVREGLLRAGYQDAGQGASADLCVVNTCTVTAEGDAKSRQVIRRMARQNPQARIVVMGCYATRAPDVLAQLPGVAEVVVDKREIPDLLGRCGVVDVPRGISQFGNRQRAFLKVQDGCLLRCSYCIIPSVRPRMISREPAEIVAEALRLAENGYRELVLTGIHLGHYGVDKNRERPKHAWLRLSNLLEQLVAIPADFRIRLSSIEAPEVTSPLLAIIRQHPDRICPHLHICLQSGSDRILRKMHRRWGSRRIVDRCQQVRDLLDEPALTTDVIVGFPGETDDDFRATCDAVQSCGFSKVHIFPFSARRGTPAADMDDTVPPHVRQDRCQQLADVESHVRQSYFRRLTGRTLRVLAETVDPHRPGRMIGTACRYAPTSWPAVDQAPGRLVHVLASAATAEGIDGAAVA